MEERRWTKEGDEIYGLKFRQKRGRLISRFERSDLISMENIMMVSFVFSLQAGRHPCREIWFQDLASGHQDKAIKGSLPFPAITLVVAVEELPGNETNLQLARAVISCLTWQHWRTHGWVFFCFFLTLGITLPVIPFPAYSFLPIPRQTFPVYKGVSEEVIRLFLGPHPDFNGHPVTIAGGFVQEFVALPCWYCWVSDSVGIYSFDDSLKGNKRLLTTAKPVTPSWDLCVPSIFLPSLIT